MNQTREDATFKDSFSDFKHLRGRTADGITRRLIQAIFEHRIQPGTRITEDNLSLTFGVSRTLARQATSRLCEIGVFVKKPNHSCIVAQPTREDAQALIDARCMVEPELLRQIVHSARTSEIHLLSKHLEMERDARQKGDRARLIRLTGEFHLKLAELAHNPYLANFIMQLQVLTCLAILVHAGGETGCPRDEHEGIVEMIEKRDADGAAEQMLKHLRHIELDLRLNEVGKTNEPLDPFRWLIDENGLD